MQFPTESAGWIALKSISGVAANDIWAVGSFNFFNITGGQASSARSYHWDGSRWISVPVGLGGYSYLASVAARATDDVWAAGEGTVGSSLNESYVTLHWNGSGWSNVANPNQGVLNAVSASSSSDAWAVGEGFVSPGTYTIRFTAP